MTDSKFIKWESDPVAKYKELERMIIACYKTLEKEIKKDIENGEKYDVVFAKQRVLQIFSQPVNWANNFYTKAESIKRKAEQKENERLKKEHKKQHIENLKKQEKELKKITPKYNKQCRYYNEIADWETKEIKERYCSIKADMFYCSTHCQFCTNRKGSDYAYMAESEVKR